MENKESTFVHLKDRVIELVYSSLDNTIDVDTLTSIDYLNLYGESITMPSLINKIGLYRAEAESALNVSVIELDIFDAELRNKYRRESAENAGKVLIVKKPEQWLKLTEKALDELITLDLGWQVKKKNVSKRTKDLGFIESLFWACKAKDQKLNHLLPANVPEDFEKDIVEGRINGMMIKKHKKSYS